MSGPKLTFYSMALLALSSPDLLFDALVAHYPLQV